MVSVYGVCHKISQGRCAVSAIAIVPLGDRVALCGLQDPGATHARQAGKIPLGEHIYQTGGRQQGRD